MSSSWVLAWLNHASVVGVTLESTSGRSHIKQGCSAESTLFHGDLHELRSMKFSIVLNGVRDTLCHVNYSVLYMECGIPIVPLSWHLFNIPP